MTTFENVMRISAWISDLCSSALQDPVLAVSVPLQRAMALHLCHVTMERGRGVPGAGKLLGEAIGVALRCGEDDRLRHFRRGREMMEKPPLVIQIVGVVKALLYLNLGRRALDREAYRIAQQSSGQFSHATFESRREQHRLALCPAGRGDRLDILDKAHVEIGRASCRERVCQYV